MSGESTVAAALAEAQAFGLERLDAHLLLAAATGRGRTWLLAHDDAPLSTAVCAAFDATVRRRAAGEPLAYILGHREFHGVDLHVTPDVLIPRPDTELLVDWALELMARSAGATTRVIDLGTGSGAIAIAIVRAAARAARDGTAVALTTACDGTAVALTTAGGGTAVEVTGVDASPAALDVAARNALRLGAHVRLLQGDWWQPVQGERYDLALSNPPYIAEDDPHLAALAHEPRAALVAGIDGLDALHRVIDGAAEHLVPGGWLLLEHGHRQAEAIQAALDRQGFEAVSTRRDLAGHARCTGGRTPSAAEART